MALLSNITESLSNTVSNSLGFLKRSFSNSLPTDENDNQQSIQLIQPKKTIYDIELKKIEIEEKNILPSSSDFNYEGVIKYLSGIKEEISVQNEAISKLDKTIKKDNLNEERQKKEDEREKKTFKLPQVLSTIGNKASGIWDTILSLIGNGLMLSLPMITDQLIKYFNKEYGDQLQWLKNNYKKFKEYFNKINEQISKDQNEKETVKKLSMSTFALSKMKNINKIAENVLGTGESIVLNTNKFTKNSKILSGILKTTGFFKNLIQKIISFITGSLSKILSILTPYLPLKALKSIPKYFTKNIIGKIYAAIEGFDFIERVAKAYLMPDFVKGHISKEQFHNETKAQLNDILKTVGLPCIMGLIFGSVGALAGSIVPFIGNAVLAAIAGGAGEITGIILSLIYGDDIYKVLKIEDLTNALYDTIVTQSFKPMEDLYRKIEKYIINSINHFENLDDSTNSSAPRTVDFKNDFFPEKIVENNETRFFEDNVLPNVEGNSTKEKIDNIMNTIKSKRDLDVFEENFRQSYRKKYNKESSFRKEVGEKNYNEFLERVPINERPTSLSIDENKTTSTISTIPILDEEEKNYKTIISKIGKKYPDSEAPIGAEPYIDIINKSEEKYNLPHGLLTNLLKTESDFNPNAESQKGAIGIAQIIPKFHPDIGNPKNPYEAIPYAAKYLRENADYFKGDWVKAVAAYNAGPSAVEKYNGVPPYEETQEYVKKVLRGVNINPIEEKSIIINQKSKSFENTEIISSNKNIESPLYPVPDEKEKTKGQPPIVVIPLAVSPSNRPEQKFEKTDIESVRSSLSTRDRFAYGN